MSQLAGGQVRRNSTASVPGPLTRGPSGKDGGPGPSPRGNGAYAPKMVNPRNYVPNNVRIIKITM